MILTSTFAIALKCVILVIVSIAFGLALYFAPECDSYCKESKKQRLQDRSDDKPKEIIVKITIWDAPEDTAGKA